MIRHLKAALRAHLRSVAMTVATWLVAWSLRELAAYLDREGCDVKEFARAGWHAAKGSKDPAAPLEMRTFVAWVRSSCDGRLDAKAQALLDAMEAVAREHASPAN